MHADRPRRVRGTHRVVQEAAKRLRVDPTSAETLLWNELRGRKLAGLKFRRQQPMGSFVLDFYCAESRLVIELDGAVHAVPEQRERDLARTTMLEAHGLRVIRFANQAVFAEMPIVLARILETTNPPLPELGEGGGEPRRAGG